MTPKDPHTGSTPADVKRYNAIATGQPGYWCQWTPCPHGCCLTWNGREKFSAGPAWLQYLISHLLRKGAFAATNDDPQFAGFTFERKRRRRGRAAGSPRGLHLLGDDDEVSQETLRPADPGYGQPGYRGLDDRPWLPDEARQEWDNDLQAWVPVPPRLRVEAGEMPG